MSELTREEIKAIMKYLDTDQPELDVAIEVLDLKIKLFNVLNNSKSDKFILSEPPSNKVGGGE